MADAAITTSIDCEYNQSSNCFCRVFFSNLFVNYLGNKSLNIKNLSKSIKF